MTHEESPDSNRFIEDLLEMLDICALAWKGEPSEEFVGSIAWCASGEVIFLVPSGVIPPQKVSKVMFKEQRVASCVVIFISVTTMPP